MSEEFVVDDYSIAELDKALARIDEQKPKDRLESIMFASRNFAAVSEWSKAIGMLIGDIAISHRANEEVLKAQYLASVEINKTIIELLKSYLMIVPTLPINQEKEEKGLKARIARWFS